MIKLNLSLPIKNKVFKITNLLFFSKNKLIAIVKGTILIFLISLVFAYIRSFIPIETNTNTEGINNRIDFNLFRIIMPLLFSPIIEELIFRKWIPDMFEDILGRIKIVLLSNLLFSIFHLDIYFIPYLANGLIYSLYYENTKDIRVSIVIHVFYNMVVFLTTYY
ncbi:CPBP family intramembrane glutamic endopeptidase [Heyndrickxia sporothermodurans]|uniref:CPBP family intramembrane glutamic endopeptidase n=1 Tax=Heyndrickxia sporothermodurans TaxID=46224 RepID=UPI0035D6BFEC